MAAFALQLDLRNHHAFIALPPCVVWLAPARGLAATAFALVRRLRLPSQLCRWVKKDRPYLRPFVPRAPSPSAKQPIYYIGDMPELGPADRPDRAYASLSPFGRYLSRLATRFPRRRTRLHFLYELMTDGLEELQTHLDRWTMDETGEIPCWFVVNNRVRAQRF